MSKLVKDGYECVSNPDLNAEDLESAIDDHQILVVRSTKISSSAINNASDLRLIIRAGAGTNTIDKAAAADRKIPVCNVPGKNAIAVAELVMGLLISIDRNIHENVSDLRSMKWNKKKYSVARGLYGRNMGIIGLGAIGLAVAERARAFGINVYVVTKPNRSIEVKEKLAKLEVNSVADMAALLKCCDVISLHVPSAADTKGLVNAEFLSQLQPNAILLNASRGDVIDEEALIAAMDDKGIKVGLDVYMNEPSSGEGDFDSILAGHINTCGTHHIGASTQQAQTAVAEGVLEIITAFNEGHVLHCVNDQG